MISIRVYDYINMFLDLCFKNNIEILNISYEDNYTIVLLKYNDYLKIKKINIYSKIEKNRLYGLRYFLFFIRNNLFNFFMILFFLFLVFFYNLFIYDVDIKCDDKKIIEKVNSVIKNYDIERFSLKKSNDELNKISDEIFNNNRDFLDFISIKKIGCKYVINLEIRKQNEEVNQEEYCDIISNKDGVVKEITVTSGEMIAYKNKTVKRGDVLISGDIIFNNEVKNRVCASGKVVLNTWYVINVTYPLTIKNKEYTGRININLKSNNNYLKKIKYEYYDEKILFEFLKFKIVKQVEYKYAYKNLTYNEAYNKAIDTGINNLKKSIKLISINDKKVLKEYKNNSKIELELFISINESVGEMVKKEKGDTFDTKESLQYNG